MSNNPVKYSDPSGHRFTEPTTYWPKKGNSILRLVEFTGKPFTSDEKNTISAAAWRMGDKFARTINRQNNFECRHQMVDICAPELSASEAFLEVMGGPVTFRRLGSTCQEWWTSIGVENNYTCWGTHAGGNTIFVFSNAPANRVAAVEQFAVHEMFHIFDSIIGDAGTSFTASDPDLMSRKGLDTSKNWQQDTDQSGLETFADIGIAWTYNHYNPIPVEPGKTDYAAYTSIQMNIFMWQQILRVAYGIP